MSGEKIANFTKSFDIQRRLENLVPAGCHTYSKGRDQFPYLSPQIMARAKGAYCWDVDGNQYLDWAMGNRVIILGHAYPAVNEAVQRQMELGLNFTRPGILEYELAEYLHELFPVAEMVKFGKNGSDVTTAAIKLARAYTDRKIVAYCKEHPFFSISDWFIGTTPCNNGVPKENYSNSVGFHYNDLESVKALFAQYPKQIAALILEPVKDDEPKPGFLPGLKELCAKEGTVLIFDEMISGVRYDLRGAHHRWGVYPDMATYGKCISNGFSFSVLAGKRDLLELGGLRHNRRRTFLLSQTHGSETTGLAAAMATLKECERVDISAHVWKLGKKFVEGVRALAKAEKVEESVRVIGLDCNPTILCTRPDGSLWPELHTAFHEEVISRGVLIPWTTITYAHGDKELEITFAALQHGMRKVHAIIQSGKIAGSFEGEPVKPVFRPFNRCLQVNCGKLDPTVAKRDCCD